jgi:hypothetical protein
MDNNNLRLFIIKNSKRETSLFEQHETKTRFVCDLLEQTRCSSLERKHFVIFHWADYGTANTNFERF